MPAESKPRRRISILGIMIALTATMCVIAIAFRNDIRSRYWAYRVAQAATLAERAAYLNHLIAAGDYAHWGLTALVDDEAAENRQFAALALQSLQSSWSRELLHRLLFDSEPAVRDIAVLGLAAHGDDVSLRHLERMYRGDQSDAALAARTACAGLQRFGDVRAVRVLAVLAEVPAPATARAALVDALDEIGGIASVLPLIALLDDDRLCSAPRYEETLAWQALGGLSPEGLAQVPEGATGVAAAPAGTPAAPGDESSSAGAASAPASGVRTIAERAAEALGRITGRRPPFLSTMSAADRQFARDQWQAWASQ